ncbi:uncharacterized protein N7496_006539 [Penicillium cataractarum]|uniref:DUF1479 domain protein n=1 Tax=Penicillium cataractarum TaxID=2100454 RepID=A0A9W9S1P7_9EURO|nr:uncharacterized protein N7496_006539 [Penicillium cataractarum]KAJ5370447.1 hypothetical protein N7496_006539 [Penicillium cataractarum]
MSTNKSFSWPNWPDITDDATTLKHYLDDPDYVAAKQKITQMFGQESLVQGWIKTCTELEALAKEVREKREGIFPVIEMEDIARGLDAPEKLDEIRRIGSFIVRGVIPSSEIEPIFEDLKEYIATNKDEITGYPHENPAIYCVYSSPAQNNLRSHPKLVDLMRWANNLWDYSESDSDTSPNPLVYADRVRVRAPGAEFLGLGPHIDSGGLCRWTEPVYREVYSDIFSGNLEGRNRYNMSKRKDADQGFYSRSGDLASTVLRSFQGWTALTKTAPQEGTILLYPNVHLAIAYVLLRPFFSPPADETKIMDPHEWTFDASGSWFPGASKTGGQCLSPSSHPHLRLKECLLHVPALDAGDTVWWHSDVCHAVDPEHVGNIEASVAYIAATPTTRINKEHMRGQYDKMALGLAPPDYSDGVDESKFKGFQGFEGKEALFKTLMGY